MSRALGLMFRLDSARLQTSSLLAGLDSLALDVVLLNQHGQVVHANQATQHARACQDGLHCNHQRKLDDVFAVPNVECLESWLENQCASTAFEVTHFAHAYLVRCTEACKVHSVQCHSLNTTQPWQIHNEAIGSVVFVCVRPRCTGSAVSQPVDGFV